LVIDGERKVIGLTMLGFIVAVIGAMLIDMR
jgi:hypothetical protein